MNKADEVAFLGIFTAIAIIAGYIERLVPSPFASIPGIKLGLANTIVIILLYVKSGKIAFGVNLTRILASGLMFSGVSGMLYSFSGGILSFIAMYSAKKSRIFGIIGVSAIGGLFHNLGQISLAALIVENVKLFYYMPLLILFGVITGILTGVIADLCIRRIKILKIYE